MGVCSVHMVSDFGNLLKIRIFISGSQIFIEIYL